MIALLAPWAARLVGERFSRAAVWMLLITAAAFAIWSAYDWAYDRGVSDERAEWNRELKKEKARRQKASDRVNARDAPIADAARSRIETDRKELDHATAPLPDRPLSDRQRARLDRELRRQGR